ncbi:MAG: ThuA domain-containing protein [Planctomycetota bacterium]
MSTPHPLRVVVWHEYRHDNPKAPNPSETSIKLYPDGMHGAMKSAIEQHLSGAAFGPYAGVEVTTATLDQDDDHGLSDELLAKTDVMTWWGHCAHGDVKDEWAEKVAQRVREGMGLVVLHSGHYAKPFKLLMGTNCHLKWREAGETERLWNVSPGHPIMAGLKHDFIQLDQTEMYGEHFDIPDPDELVFVSWFEGGEVFRSGCVWKRGAGKVFYFRPGHETFPIYHQDEVRRVLANGVQYVAPPLGAVPQAIDWKSQPGNVVKAQVDGGVTPYRSGSPNINPPLSPIAGDHEVDESIHEQANA